MIDKRGEIDHETLSVLVPAVVTVTPMELIRDRQCTPGCLAATTGVSRCTCPYGGRFHALVAGADVSALIESRRSGLDRRTDLLVVTDAA